MPFSKKLIIPSSLIFNALPDCEAANAATDLPPRFEQYVTVEVTIDVDGNVADARIVAGEVSIAIQRKLLSAIREFKYNPATRNGAPAAFQLDIVIHIPT